MQGFEKGDTILNPKNGRKGFVISTGGITCMFSADEKYSLINQDDNILFIRLLLIEKTSIITSTSLHKKKLLWE